MSNRNIGILGCVIASEVSALLILSSLGQDQNGRLCGGVVLASALLTLILSVGATRQ